MGEDSLRPIVSTIGTPTYSLTQYLAVGNSPCHVKNSMEFINIIRFLHADPEETLISFDVISLFTVVPIGGDLHFLSWHFEHNIWRLFCHVLTSSLFRFNGQFYEETSGVAVDSPSFVIVNFFTEHFEGTPLEEVTHKPLC
jgi:hypothetical protein